jgi:hypothetical protein
MNKALKHYSNLMFLVGVSQQNMTLQACSVFASVLSSRHDCTRKTTCLQSHALMIKLKEKDIMLGKSCFHEKTGSKQHIGKVML